MTSFVTILGAILWMLRAYWYYIVLIVGTFCVIKFVPWPYKLWILLGGLCFSLALLGVVYLREWLGDTVVLDKKRYRFFAGNFDDDQEAGKAVTILNKYGHEAIVASRKWNNSQVPCVYVRWAKDKPRLYPCDIVQLMERREAE